mmetsp:Transcript_4179/g.7114  ORF Transcript_4179/g.7114 Transcript_4179/m.7114 type:complete len:295 (-) Transcript_4179:39-923(-)
MRDTQKGGSHQNTQQQQRAFMLIVQQRHRNNGKQAPRERQASVGGIVLIVNAGWVGVKIASKKGIGVRVITAAVPITRHIVQSLRHAPSRRGPEVVFEHVHQELVVPDSVSISCFRHCFDSPFSRVAVAKCGILPINLQQFAHRLLIALKVGILQRVTTVRGANEIVSAGQREQISLGARALRLECTQVLQDLAVGARLRGILFDGSVIAVPAIAATRLPHVAFVGITYPFTVEAVIFDHVKLERGRPTSIHVFKLCISCVRRKYFTLVRITTSPLTPHCNLVLDANFFLNRAI